MAKRKRPNQQKNSRSNAQGKSQSSRKSEMGKSTTNSGSQRDDQNSSNHGDSSDSNKEAEQSGKEAHTPASNSINDPSWYTKYPALAYGAGNIPFSEPFGTPLLFGDKTFVLYNGDHKWTYNPEKVKNNAVPGVCSLVTKPTYGASFDYNDALNVAANQLYTNVRYVNSGRKNYDAPDLMIMLMAISELYSFIMWCQRLYGYTYMYSISNKYINKALIEANGVNSDDIKANLANFRYWLNTFISRVSAFAVPADINIFRRRAFMYAHLYTESTTGNIKDQLYQFVPDGFHKFQLDDTISHKGMLKYKRLGDFYSGKLKLGDLVGIGESLLANINGDEDFGLMSGDIIKAYGSNILRLDVVPEALIITPEYEEFTLSQMRNANIVDCKRGDASNVGFNSPLYPEEVFFPGDVMQSNNGNLISAECISDVMTDNTLGAVLPEILTVTNPNPTVDDVLEASRLTVSANVQDSRISQNDDFLLLECGSDIVTSVRISSYSWNGSNQFVLAENTLTENWLDGQVWNLTKLAELVSTTAFHWFPTLKYYTKETSGSGSSSEYSITSMGLLSNVDNYTSLTNEVIKRLHECCILSLLSVPGAAQIVG